MLYLVFGRMVHQPFLIANEEEDQDHNEGHGKEENHWDNEERAGGNRSSIGCSCCIESRAKKRRC